MRALLCGFLGMLLVCATSFADSYEDAQKAFKDKKYKQTVKLLDAHLKDNKEDAKAYFMRGQAHNSLKAYPEAMSDFNKTIELDPKYARVYYLRGKLFAQDLKTDKALVDFDKSLELNPKQAAVYIERGNLNMMFNSPEHRDKALKDFEQALKLNPQLPAGYLGRARVSLEKNAQTSTFERDGKTYVAISGYHPDSVKQGLIDLDKAIELNAKLTHARVLRALCYESVGDAVKEVAERKELATLDKANGPSLNRLVWLLAASPEPKARDGKAALEYAKQLIESIKDKDAEPFFLDALAAAHAEAGDFKQALATQEKAIAMLKPPEKSPFHERLALYKQNKPYRMPAIMVPPPKK